jgi:hypothetical protein
MKVYRVVLVDGVWCAFTGEHGRPVICCEDKSILVECARARPKTQWTSSYLR